MAAIISAEQITKHYSDKRLFTDTTVYIHEGEKIGVVGQNGAGKTTLLRTLAGLDTPDRGSITRQKGLRVAFLEQAPDFTQPRTVLEEVLCQVSADFSDAQAYEAKRMLTRLQLHDFSADVRTLSGGQKKRVALAAAMIRPADILFMDEPTNHLDVETILWLETMLKGYKGAVMMVTHDRYFLDRVCGRIWEIDREGVFVHEGNFSYYLEQRAAREEMEDAAARKRKSLLRTELEWIRRGPQGRGTKQKARIERFETLKNHEDAPERTGIDLSGLHSRLGKKIIEMENVSKAYGEKQLLCDFTYTVLRDDRVGIIGENGCGKTTLLKMILGKEAPSGGSIRIGETVKVGYFAQDYPEVAGDLRLIDYMRSIGEYIDTPEGKLTAAQMLERFGFSGGTQYTQVARLSGGERRRLYLASVLMDAPNVLLLDEPTNDLDITTLQVLEDHLDAFQGAVLVVSHDRYFLTRTTQRFLSFEDEGQVRLYVCTYDEYMQTRQEEAEKKREAVKEASEPKRERVRELRFSFNEQREYETIDETIAALEEKIRALDVQVAENASDYQQLQTLMDEKEKQQAALDNAMERWVYLNDLAERIDRERLLKDCQTYWTE